MQPEYVTVGSWLDEHEYKVSCMEARRIARKAYKYCKTHGISFRRWGDEGQKALAFQPNFLERFVLRYFDIDLDYWDKTHWRGDDVETGD